MSLLFKPGGGGLLKVEHTLWSLCMHLLTHLSAFCGVHTPDQCASGNRSSQ